MDLVLTRKEYTDKSTIGELEVDGKFKMYTLEDVVRTKKIKGETAIPAGTYDISFNYSPKYKRMMPLLDNVPNFEGVRIHSGNTDADTEGCILVGKTKSKDFVGKSRDAINELWELFVGAFELKERITIKIIDTKAV